jgi:osmoprotectant transport system permease protein
MKVFLRALLPVLVLAALASAGGDSNPEVKVGSKKFTESVILGEIAADLAKNAGARVVHRRELGGTRVLWDALLKGEIDIYPEYTGTISREILAGEGISDQADPAELRAALIRYGILMTGSLGFNNTYALGMKKEKCKKLGIGSISDLRRYPDLKFGFGNEFMDRADGWPGLRKRYGLPQKEVFGIDHDLAYRGLENESIDATDLYTTDAEIRYYSICMLEDDLHYFPVYEAVLLYRADLARRAPAVAAALHRLEGKIPESEMIGMNALVKLDKTPEGRVAGNFLSRHLALNPAVDGETVAARIWRHTTEHLYLVSISLLAAVLFSVPLGIIAAKMARTGQLIIGIVGIIQTIPSLALLVFMIPLMGIGGPPAIVALFLYSLLPIVRNTFTGLREIPQDVRESAEALGLPAGARLWLVELPLASRSILAGIKTSAVINVGTATLGALIGAGGYGQPILTGIRLDNTGLILQGAVPAAVLALVVQGLFELVERILVPRGLRLKS